MIEILCVGMSKDKITTKIGGCGVVLIATDEHKRKQKREFSFGLGNSPQILTDIQACRLALSSVIPASRHTEVMLYLDNPEVASVLTNDTTIAAFKEQIAELKRWKSYYKNLTINVVDESNLKLSRARELALIGLESQENTDSGTLQEP